MADKIKYEIDADTKGFVSGANKIVDRLDKVKNRVNKIRSIMSGIFGIQMLEIGQMVAKVAGELIDRFNGLRKASTDLREMGLDSVADGFKFISTQSVEELQKIADGWKELQKTMSPEEFKAAVSLEETFGGMYDALKEIAGKETVSKEVFSKLGDEMGTALRERLSENLGRSSAEIDKLIAKGKLATKQLRIAMLEEGIAQIDHSGEILDIDAINEIAGDDKDLGERLLRDSMSAQERRNTMLDEVEKLRNEITRENDEKINEMDTRMRRKGMSDEELYNSMGGDQRLRKLEQAIKFGRTDDRVLSDVSDYEKLHDLRERLIQKEEAEYEKNPPKTYEQIGKDVVERSGILADIHGGTDEYNRNVARVDRFNRIARTEQGSNMYRQLGLINPQGYDKVVETMDRLARLVEKEIEETRKLNTLK